MAHVYIYIHKHISLLKDTQFLLGQAGPLGVLAGGGGGWVALRFGGCLKSDVSQVSRHRPVGQ